MTKLETKPGNESINDPLNKYDFDILVSKFLRYGVFLVAIFLTLGWILEIDLKGNVFASYEHYQERNLFDSLTEAWVHKKMGLLLSYFGLGLLISLPLFRVIMTGILFAKKKEYEMMSLCLVVLFGLALSVFLGAVK